VQGLFLPPILVTASAIVTGLVLAAAGIGSSPTWLIVVTVVGVMVGNIGGLLWAAGTLRAAAPAADEIDLSAAEKPIKAEWISGAFWMFVAPILAGVAGVMVSAWVGLAPDLRDLLSRLFQAGIAYSGVLFASFVLALLVHRHRQTQWEEPGTPGIGEVVVAESRTVLRTVLIVLGWAVGATAAAITLAAVGVNLPQEAQPAAGIAVPLAFLCMLVLGPIWTIRWLHRRHQVPPGTHASPQRNGTRSQH
jgi:hypothetical protein